MVTETVMLKIETARQAAQVAAAQGKTFTVGKAVAGGGMKNMLILNPTTAGGQSIAVQLAGNNQAATVAAMGGKTVTIGNSPLMLGGGASKWVVVKPVAGAVTAGAAGTGAAGVAAKGGAAKAGGAAAAKAGMAAKAGAAGMAVKTAGAAAAADITITQIQGANSILIEVTNAKQAAMAKAAGGKAFTVMAPPVGANANNMLFLKPAGAAAGQGGNQVMMLKVQEGANQIPSLIGKTFSVNKAPIAAGVGPKNLIILKPVTVTAKSAAATSAAAAKTAGGKAAAGATMKTGATAKAAGGMAGKPMMMNAAMTTPAATSAGKACVAGKSAATATTAAATAKTTVAAGTIWSGTGWSLGLGLGLGAWGPVILGGLAAAGIYGYVRNKKDQEAHKSDNELQPAH